MAKTTGPLSAGSLPLSRILMGKLRIPEAPRPCSAPRMPGTAAPDLECGIPGVRGGGEGRSEGRGSAPGSRARALGCQPCAPAAGKGVREGATSSRAWRSSPFFPADPGKGGRFGGGTAKGGDSLPRASRALAPLPAGSCGEQRRDGEHELGGERGVDRRAGHWGERGRTEPPRGPMRRVGRWPRRA